MAAYGLHTHIQSNKRRSIALLIGLFFLVYLLVYAGALVGETLTNDAPLDVLMRAALRDALYAAPWATLGTALWILIAYKFHQSMIDAVTGGHEVTRQEEPRLYNLLENLCISRGIPMPKLKIMEDEALNAFASGLNEKQYSITVTSGLMARLDDAELEAVLGHELTHIRNGDVRLLIIAVIIAGVISFFAEIVFRGLFQGGFNWRGSRRRGGSRPWQRRRHGGSPDSARADCDRLAPFDRDSLCALAPARVSGRCRLGRTHQESRRHDLGAAQDGRRGRAGRLALRRDGNVRGQSALRLCRPVLDPPLGRQPRRGAGQVCRWP